MFCIAAHTGARRSEIRRALPEDIGPNVLTIRERKRRRGKLSLRSVPMSNRLKSALADWLHVRPHTGEKLFCHVAESYCVTPEGEEVTQHVIDNQFERAILPTRFKHLIGLHVLRHSFCSNCAAAGIDQRMIDAWVGHTTDEMRRRYRHLFPSKEQQTLETVFG
jgi:integrase